MKTYISFILLRLFGKKLPNPDQSLYKTGVKTVDNTGEKLDYNSWIYGIYKELNHKL